MMKTVILLCNNYYYADTNKYYNMNKPSAIVIKTVTWGNCYGNFTTTTYVNGKSISSFSGDMDPDGNTSYYDNTWSKSYSYTP